MKKIVALTAGISCFVSCTAIAGVEDAFSLEIKHDGYSKSLKFTREQYAAFKKSPEKLLNVLGDEGADCCAPQKKVSETVWRCCDGHTIIVASSYRAGVLLDAAFEAKKPDAR